MDNYLDGGYHVSVLHKDLTAGLDIDSYKTEVQERYSMQKVQGKERATSGTKTSPLYLSSSQTALNGIIM